MRCSGRILTRDATLWLHLYPRPGSRILVHGLVVASWSMAWWSHLDLRRDAVITPRSAMRRPQITHFLDIEVIFYVSWGVGLTSAQFSICDTFLTCGNASALKLGEPLCSQLPKKSPLRRGFRPNYRHFWLRYPKNALFGVLRKPLPPLCS